MTNQLHSSLGRLPLKSVNKMKMSLQNMLKEESPMKPGPLPKLGDSIIDRGDLKAGTEIGSEKMGRMCTIV